MWQIDARWRGNLAPSTLWSISTKQAVSSQLAGAENPRNGDLQGFRHALLHGVCDAAPHRFMRPTSKKQTRARPPWVRNLSPARAVAAIVAAREISNLRESTRGWSANPAFSARISFSHPLFPPVACELLG
jgi:hypothetical protein